MNRNILVLGCNGQVGWELQRSLAPHGTVITADRKQIDLTNQTNLAKAIENAKPDIIVNAAAYTAVDKAEEDIKTAKALNVKACQTMAQYALKNDKWLIHYSTDYVFDGTKNGQYQETDTPNPLGVYGATKLAGENAIKESGCNHIILRTSWVFASRAANFIKTMLRLGAEREQLNIVADQIGAPTSAELLADITAHIVCCLKEDVSGTYHLTASGETSWHAFAQFVFDRAKEKGQELAIKQVNPISTQEYPTPARRPLNSRLNCDKLCQTFGVTLPGWQYHATRAIDELVEQA